MERGNVDVVSGVVSGSQAANRNISPNGRSQGQRRINMEGGDADVGWGVGERGGEERGKKVKRRERRREGGEGEKGRGRGREGACNEQPNTAVHTNRGTSSREGCIMQWVGICLPPRKSSAFYPGSTHNNLEYRVECST